MKDAKKFYEEKHGSADFLSKDAIIKLLKEYADHKFECFKNREINFKTSQWQQEVKDRSAKRDSSPKP